MGLTLTGSGTPVTVAAHGLGASVAETRPLLSGVPGTKVFYEARGHGGAPPPQDPGYGELAADLQAVLDAHGATQALGVSMGAATVLRLLSQDPTRLERAVLFLPAALDRPRTDEAVRRSAGRAGTDPEAVEAAVRAELPTDLEGPAVTAYVRARTDFLLQCDLEALVAALPGDVPVHDRTALAAVTADVLVLGQEGDPLHPAQVAREVAAALPRARLVVFDAPGVLFRERARLRELVSAHLGQ